MTSKKVSKQKGQQKIETTKQQKQGKYCTVKESLGGPPP